MPNDLKTKIFFWIFGPVYKRIFQECEAGMQELSNKQKKFQEDWVTPFQVEESERAPADKVVGATPK